MDCSSLFLKKLDPNETLFATIDLSSRYPLVFFDPASRNLFSVILPQGKFRYTVLPLGAASSCDIFNIISDKGIINQKMHFKNVDNNLTTSISQMEGRLLTLILLCRETNMKLTPEKFEVWRSGTLRCKEVW